jgi:hypothetical protein
MLLLTRLKFLILVAVWLGAARHSHAIQGRYQWSDMKPRKLSKAGKKVLGWLEDAYTFQMAV